MEAEDRDAGFTLIELMISMGLFALIAVAGLALVDGIINVQGRTDGRLDRLAAIQRSLFLVESDIEQVAPGRIAGGGAEIRFTRTAPGIGGVPVELRYAGAAGSLVRSGGPIAQQVLDGVASVRWRFWDGGWIDRWPASEAARDRWPRAVALEMQVAGPNGAPVSVRRVVTLPDQPREDEQ